MEDLPSKVNVIVVGTGLAESIISAAVSRNGHTVLHLDPRDYYGGKWTTVNWEGLQSETFAVKDSPCSTSFSSGQEKEDDVKKSVVQVESEFVWNNPIQNVEQVWYTEDDDKKTEISKQSRKFNIDVFPKVLLAREELIQLLIESNVSRYLEFKCITKLFTSLPPPQQNIIEPIPLSRSDIFTTKSLGLVEKRKLTKFIESVLNTESAHPSLSTSSSEQSTTTTVKSPPSSVKTFDELVQSTKINEKIQHLIKSAVRTVEDGFENSNVAFNTEFLDRCRLFLQSIGRYGNQTPYLWTLYGIGEVCQAFCRLSAIYGGIFILKRSIQKASLVKVETEKSEESFAVEQLLQVKTNDLEIKTKYLVLGAEVKHSQISKTERSKTVVRGILLTTGGPLKHDISSEKGEGNQMYVYKIGNAEVIELDHSSLAVPKPFRLVHVSCPLNSEYKVSQMSPRSIVEAILEPFLNFNPRPSPKKEAENSSTENVEEKSDDVNSTSDNQSDPNEPRSSPSGDSEPKEEEFVSTNDKTSEKPSVLYGSYFLIDFLEDKNKIEEGNEEHVGGISSHILHCATGSTEITQEIKKARDIFKIMYPQEPFLPKTTDGSETSEQDEDNEEEHDEPIEEENSTRAEGIHADQIQEEENKEKDEPISSSSLPSST